MAEGAVKRGLVTAAGVFCGLLAASELWALAGDGPEDGDPAGLLWGLPVVALLMAVASIAQRRLPLRATGLAGLSFSLSVLWWTLIVLFSG